MVGLASDLRREVDGAEAGLRALAQHDTATPLRSGGWSKRQILGHLIDSASNNHQRFVRAQLGEVRLPSYEQEPWVACQDYASSDWATLVELWVAYNRHLTHVIEAMPAAALDATCRVGESEPMPMRELIGDYLAHMRHHLAQLRA